MALSKPIVKNDDMSSDGDFEEPANMRFRELTDEELSEIQDDLDPKTLLKVMQNVRESSLLIFVGVSR